jgi:hypothetical protein
MHVNTTPTYGYFKYEATKSLDRMHGKYWDFSTASLDLIDRKNEMSE